VGGLRSEPVSSDEPPPLLHLPVDLFECLRRLVRACFWGVVGTMRPGGLGSESRDDDDVNSDSDSVVEEPELAMTVACGWALAREKNAGRLGVVEACGAPLFGGDAG
jgi:hypothetical protein